MCLDFFATLDSKSNYLEYGKSYYIESLLLYNSGQYLAACEAAEKSIAILGSIRYAGGTSWARLCKGKALFELGRFEEAIEDLSTACNYYKKTPKVGHTTVWKHFVSSWNRQKFWGRLMYFTILIALIMLRKKTIRTYAKSFNMSTVS